MRKERQIKLDGGRILNHGKEFGLYPKALQQAEGSTGFWKLTKAEIWRMLEEEQD